VLQSLLPYPHSCQGTSPHQQGWDMKMAMLSFCGIDVSKDRLETDRSLGAMSKQRSGARTICFVARDCYL
jgi:hypothetical protein